MPEPIPRAQVLVVIEDEPDMRMMIRALLSTDSRLEIVGEAASAHAAFELLRTHTPGLILLDHSIEGDVMGLQAAPMLKEAAPGAKILLFTAFDMQTEALAEPAIDAYLSKSNVSQLLPTVQKLLGLS